MKVTNLKEELKKISFEELEQKLDDLRRELFSSKLNSATAHIKDYSQFNKLRKNIARTLTFMRQKEQSNAVKAED